MAPNSRPEAVVEQLVALDRVADLELHDGRAGQVRLEARAGEFLGEQRVDAADYLLGALLLHELAIERQHRQCQLAIIGQELAGDDVVGFQRRDDGVVGGFVAGEVVGDDGCGIAGGVGPAAGRQHRHHAVHAVAQLEIDDGAPEGLDLRLLEEVLALDHDKDVVLARWEASIDLLIAAELLGIGAEQLRQGVVDPQQGKAPRRQRRYQRDQRQGEARPPEPHIPGPLQTERKRTAWNVRCGVHEAPSNSCAGPAVSRAPTCTARARNLCVVKVARLGHRRKARACHTPADRCQRFRFVDIACRSTMPRKACRCPTRPWI